MTPVSLLHGLHMISNSLVASPFYFSQGLVHAGKAPYHGTRSLVQVWLLLSVPLDPCIPVCLVPLSRLDSTYMSTYMCHPSIAGDTHDSRVSHLVDSASAMALGVNLMCLVFH